MSKSICQKCKGKGALFQKIRTGSQIEIQWVCCDFPGCHNGTVDREENYRIIQGISLDKRD